MKVNMDRHMKEKIEKYYYLIYRPIDFFKNWIYPAYYLKNFIFKRYDLIKIKGVKPYEWVDKNYVMLQVNMQLIEDFIEKENPEKYVLWYKDEDGNDVGHKLGEYNTPIVYSEYKDKFVMDVIKEIYNWWKKEYPDIKNDYEYLLQFWHENLCGKLKMIKDEDSDYYHMDFDDTDTIKSINELNSLKNINWKIINKYFSDKEELINENKVREVFRKLEIEIYNQEQKYLHLCIDVRPYLWI